MRAVTSSCLWLLCMGSALAQSFPLKDKAITLVVPFTAGGPTDRLARDMAQALSKPLGGSAVVVENALGAGGAIATQKVARAAPDGHTLLIHHIGMATMPALIRKPSFDVLNDFDYLGMIHEVPMTIVARPTLEANDYKQLSAWVLSQKDKVNLGNAGIGSASHLCGLLWQSSMRTEMTTINYKGVSMAMNDLLGGQIDVLCDQTTNTLSYIESRKIKAYAVTSSKRLPQAALKDFPTLQEVGLKGFQVSVWHAVYAPKGLPPETKSKLYSALRSVLSDAAFIQKQEAMGAVMIIDKRSNPTEHKKFVAAEIAKWSPIIKAAGVYAD